MQTIRSSKIVRTALVTGSLLAALTVGSVAADSNQIGLTECDHGCKVEMLAGSSAEFSIVDVTPFDASGYESAGPGQLGFTR